MDLDGYRDCRFKDVFGVPRQVIEKFGLGNWAIIDTVVIFASGMALQTYLFKGHSLWILILSTLIVSQIFHYVFCIDTLTLIFLRQVFNGKDKKAE
jgi:hypothetical protein